LGDLYFYFPIFWCLNCKEGTAGCGLGSASITNVFRVLRFELLRGLFNAKTQRRKGAEVMRALGKGMECGCVVGDGGAFSYFAIVSSRQRASDFKGVLLKKCSRILRRDDLTSRQYLAKRNQA
jgi:hypothetical protein